IIRESEAVLNVPHNRALTLRWLGKWVWAGSRSQKSRPLTISDQGATLRVTTLIRTGFDANASTVPILIPGMVTGAPVSVA
ncbi:hypothetical protein, partial [Lacticaseibacillus paracasei]|uniref:hypothetical protein n=1 Tax=Lacticaseibacillus paracasei TaxID=1597 RepID=UPI0031CE3973